MTAMLYQVKYLCYLHLAKMLKQKSRIIGPSPRLSYPCGFFDGAAAKDLGGAGFVLHLSKLHFFAFSLGCGSSTNNKAGLLALWALLAVSKIMGIPLHSIYGDSLIIVNWANLILTLNSPFLYHWRKDIKSHILHFPSLTINHIYQEHNQQADSLSKNALDLDPSFGIFSEHLNGMISDHGNF